jgi:hypothetical protein
MTYLNAYNILEVVRMELDEWDVDITQGIDTATAFSNTYVMQKINDSQRYIYHRYFKLRPEQFIKSATLTFSGSSAVLPWDFGMIHELKDENDTKVFRIEAKQKTRSTSTGSDSYYYQQGNSLKLDKTGVSKNYTLWFYSKPRELDQGRITASGALSITLDSSAKKVDDYYNDMTIENVTADWIDTIDDYTSGRVATISETSLNIDDIYGMVSELPEPLHFLIPLRAVLDIKLRHPLVKEKATTAELAAFEEQFNLALAVFGHSSEDITISDIFTDYAPFSTIRTSILSD